MALDFASGAQLIELCRKENISIGRAMLLRECAQTEASEEEVRERMRSALRIMRESAMRPQEAPVRSVGGLIGGEARDLAGQKDPLCGSLLHDAMTMAAAVLEVNASMGVIVAAPTAGSAGVVPGVLLSMEKHRGLSEEDLLEGLFAAGAVGYLLMRLASVSGAEAGCQAEVGSAAAMAAAAAVTLCGGSAQMSLDAASFALGNLLGLVCDPIAGLVERPCQSRNVLGVADALTAADLALAGVRPAVPFDEMAQAMQKVGRALPVSLRETAKGGCAATPSGKRLKEIIFGCGRP